MTATSDPTTEQMAGLLRGLWPLYQRTIAALSPDGRRRLAADVRLLASDDPALTTGDLDALVDEIEQGAVTWTTAHYVEKLGAYHA